MTAALFVAAAIALPLRGSGAERRPSTPQERDRALRLAHLLETEPLGDEAKRAREWLTVWLIQIPDVTVTLCSTLLGPLPPTQKNYSTELVSQMMYSSAAFIIQNPNRAADDLAVYTAGVEGSLRVYEGILKSKPEARWPFLDELLKKRDRGTLGQYVAEAKKECK